jgi:hypothetical protein
MDWFAMQTTSSLSRATRRGDAYWYEDGLSELAFGTWQLLIGLLVVGAGAVPRFGGLIVYVGVLFLGPCLPLCRSAVRRLKERITYPRTGYAERRSLPGAVEVVIGVAVPSLVLLAAGAIALASMRWTSIPDTRSPIWAPVFVGTIVAVGSVVAVAVSRQVRFAATGVIGALGVALPAAGITGSTASGMICAAAGVATVGLGARALRGYLREHPRAEGDGA